MKLKAKLLALLEDDPHDVNFLTLFEEIFGLLSLKENDSYQRMRNALEQYRDSIKKVTDLQRDLKNPTLIAQERFAILADIEREEKKRDEAEFALRKEAESL